MRRLIAALALALAMSLPAGLAAAGPDEALADRLKQTELAGRVESLACSLGAGLQAGLEQNTEGLARHLGELGETAAGLARAAASAAETGGQEATPIEYTDWERALIETRFGDAAFFETHEALFAEIARRGRAIAAHVEAVLDDDGNLRDGLEPAALQKAFVAVTRETSALLDLFGIVAAKQSSIA